MSNHIQTHNPPLAPINDPRCCDYLMCSRMPSVRFNWWNRTASVYCPDHAAVMRERVTYYKVREEIPLAEHNHAYTRLAYSDAPELLERLSRALHAIYQNEAARQSRMSADTKRWPDDYDALPEHTKDYDRALAIFIMEEIAAPNQVKEALDELGIS